MKQIYSPQIFYRRVGNLLKELKAPEIRSPMDVQRFLAVFRSGFWLGVWGKLAVTLAIYGHHYRRICEKYIFIASDGEATLD